MRHNYFHVAFIFIALTLILLNIGQAGVNNIGNLILTWQALAQDMAIEKFLPLNKCDSTDIPITQAWIQAKRWLFSHAWVEAEICLQLYFKKQGQLSDLILFVAAFLAAQRGDWEEASTRMMQMPQKNVAPVKLVATAYKLADAGNWAKADSNLRRANFYFGTFPLFTALYEEGQEQLQLVSLQQTMESTADQLALATQYWRLAEYAIAGSLAEKILARPVDLSARQRAWAWYLVAVGFQQTGQSYQVLSAYQTGMDADSTLIANYWGALDWLALHPEIDIQAAKNLNINLEHILPEGQLRQWPSAVSNLLGYTLLPSSDLAPDSIYDLYLFWSLDAPEATNINVKRTSRWAIQRFQLRNQATLGHFDFSGQEGKVIYGWEDFLYPGELGTASIQTALGASGGALRLVPRGKNSIGLRGVPPLTGIPVQPQTRYLLTGRTRVEKDGVTSIRCIWYTSSQEALELDGQGVPSYFEVYNGEWINSGVLLNSPPSASSCELRVVYEAGTGAGWFDDIRLFELSNIRGR